MYKQLLSCIIITCTCTCTYYSQMNINIINHMIAALKYSTIYTQWITVYLPSWTIAVFACKIAPGSRRYQVPNESQVLLLDTAFNTTCYPNKPTIKQLVQQTGLTEQKIYQWFNWKRRQRREAETGTTLSIGEKAYQHTCI